MKNYKLNDLIDDDNLIPFCEYNGEIYYDAKISNGFAEYARWSPIEQREFDKLFSDTYKVSKSGRHIRIFPSLQSKCFQREDIKGNTFFGKLTTYDKQLSVKYENYSIKVADYISTACTFLATFPECCRLQVDHRVRKADCESEYLFNEVSNLSWTTPHDHLDKTKMENSNPQNKGTKNPAKAREIIQHVESIIDILSNENNPITKSLAIGQRKDLALLMKSKISEIVN